VKGPLREGLEFMILAAEMIGVSIDGSIVTSDLTEFRIGRGFMLDLRELLVGAQGSFSFLVGCLEVICRTLELELRGASLIGVILRYL
jgi:hypothetical protein